MRLALMLHLLAIVFWIGGMAFMHVALRPALAEALEPPQRLTLLVAIMRRFFAGVTLAILLIFATGAAMLAIAPARNAAVHAMVALAVVMTAVFAYIRLRSYPVLRKHVEAREWAAAGAAAVSIRRLVGFNLAVGIAIIGITTAWP
jgi:uncharacterized membrane protein